ncbi:MAG: phosphate acyltransferase PlsX [Pseudomonadota bacterium]
MSQGQVIAIDAMSGDAGPAPVVAGLARALRHLPDTRFLICGDEAEIGRQLARRRNAGLAGRVTLRHAPDVIRMDDLPTRALRTRRESSMWAALRAVRDGEAAVALSPGNTGALMLLALIILRRAPGIDRPAIAVHWPACQPHGFNTVLDVGADVRAEPRTLVQYAVMGAEYARLSFGLARPTVGLLNIGTEAHKGNEDLRLATETLGAIAGEADAPFTHHGFVEGNHIGLDTVDVIVTDGFTGNIALKTAEGTASFIRDGLKEAFSFSPLSRIGSLFAFTSLRRLKKRIDPRRVNGGVLLGLNGSVVKSHGGADAVGVAAAVRLAGRLAEGDITASVARQLGRLDLSPLETGGRRDSPTAEPAAERDTAARVGSGLSVDGRAGEAPEASGTGGGAAQATAEGSG